MRPLKDVHARAWEAVVMLFRCGTGVPEKSILGRYGPDAFSCLRGLKAIEPDEPLKTVLCPCCCGEMLDVDEDMDTGELSAFCPECLGVSIGPELVRRWRLRRNWLPTEIAAAFGISRPERRAIGPDVIVVGESGKSLIAITRNISRVLMDIGILKQLRPGGHGLPMVVSTRPGRISDFLNPVGAVFVPLESSFTLSGNGLSYVDYVTPDEPMAVVNGFSPDFLHYYEGGRETVEFTPMQASIFRTMAEQKTPSGMKEILERADTNYRTFHEAFKVRGNSKSHSVELLRNTIALRVIHETSRGLYELKQ